MSGGDVVTTDSPGVDAEFLRTLVSNAPVGLVTFDADGRIVFANSAIQGVLGYSPDELVGRSTTALVPERLRSVPGSDLGRFVRGDVRGVTALAVEFPARHREGHEVHVSLRLGGHEHRGEDLVTCTVSDVGDRRRREQSLREQNRALEEFADVLSHDLRNPLVVADNHVSAAREAAAREDDDGEELRRVSEALNRLEQIIDDTLVHTRSGATVESTETVALGRVARAAWDGVPTDGASLVVPDGAWHVHAHPGRLRQLAENIVRNAVEHGSTSPPSNTRENAVEHGSTSPPSNAREDAVENGGNGVTVSVGVLDDGAGFYVEDDGPGLPASVRTRLESDRGTAGSRDGGYGLGIVGRIAAQHGWEMRPADAASGGARLEFWGAPVFEG